MDPFLQKAQLAKLVFGLMLMALLTLTPRFAWAGAGIAATSSDLAAASDGKDPGSVLRAGPSQVAGAEAGPGSPGGCFECLLWKAVILVLFPSLPSTHVQVATPQLPPPPRVQPPLPPPVLPPALPLTVLPPPTPPPGEEDPLQITGVTPPPTSVHSPEPATLVSGLLACGLVGLFALHRRWRRSP